MPKILIIDDDFLLRATLRAALEQKGYDILEARNGVLGVEQARIHLPDIILSDVWMDEEDGYAVLEKLRADPATATIPFILMTAAANPEGMRQGMRLGADDYLAKPFSFSDLIATLETRLKKKAVLQQTAEKKLADLRASISLVLPHELNTPLVGILSLGELIRDSAPLLKPEDLSKLGENIVASGYRLERLIKNFLVYTQLEVISLDPVEQENLRKNETPNPANLTAELARKKSKEFGRIPDLEMDMENGSIAISPDLFLKLVEELVDNAFKFSQPGSPVGIRSNIFGNQFHLHIIDEGRGLLTSEIAEIGAFVQFHRKIYQQKGVGLGLAIAKKLAEIHLGQFHIRSRPEKGSEIRVSLPLV